MQLVVKPPLYTMDEKKVKLNMIKLFLGKFQKTGFSNYKNYLKDLLTIFSFLLTFDEFT